MAECQSDLSGPAPQQSEKAIMASEESSDDCHQNGLIDNPKIVIIGAGISGIAAGSYLAQSGFTDFVILEATDRIGGRIHSIDLGEFPF